MAVSGFATAISLAVALGSAKVPTRAGVVSLNLCTDELVLLVARPDQIRSLSYLSHLAEETPLWRRARRYGANDGSMPAAAAVVAGGDVRPALVVTMGSAARDRSRIDAAIGARLLVLPFPTGLNDVADNVLRIGRATGNLPRAAGIVAAMRAAVRNAPPPREAVWIDGAGRTLSPDGLGAAWMRVAGMRQRRVAGDRLSLEDVIVAPPSLLVRSRYRAGQMSSATAWQRHPIARRVPAARTLVTDGRRWTCMGPTLLAEVLRLRGLLSR